jgi:hypothetical protein
MNTLDYIIIGIIALWFIYCVALLIRRGRGGQCMSCSQCQAVGSLPNGAKQTETMDCKKDCSRNCRKCMEEAGKAGGAKETDIERNKQ